MTQEHQKAELIITHEFNAPKKLVFNAFADAKALAAWWGPVETKNIVIKLDFRIGGIFHYKMEGKGKTTYGRFLFYNIQPYDLLEFSNAFADINANIVKPPFDIQLPLEIFYSLAFSEKKGKTTITMTGRPLRASNEEERTFRSIEDSMRQGFDATFSRLSQYLDEIQSVV